MNVEKLVCAAVEYRLSRKDAKKVVVYKREFEKHLQKLRDVFSTKGCNDQQLKLIWAVEVVNTLKNYDMYAKYRDDIVEIVRGDSSITEKRVSTLLNTSYSSYKTYLNFVQDVAGTCRTSDRDYFRVVVNEYILQRFKCAKFSRITWL